MPKKRKKQQRGLPKGTKFIRINNFRLSQKRWNKFVKMADKSNAMRRELDNTELFGSISKSKQNFESKKDFDALFKRLQKRTSMSASEYKVYRERVFQRNYIDGLYASYGEKKNIKEVADIIENMDAETFYDAYQDGYLPPIYSFYNEYDDTEYFSLIKQQIQTAPQFIG